MLQAWLAMAAHWACLSAHHQRGCRSLVGKLAESCSGCDWAVHQSWLW